MSATEADDEQEWSWIGQLSGVDGEERSFHTIITIGHDETIQIHLSDGAFSYGNSLSREQLLDCCESPSVAHVDRSERISRIRAALESDDRETKCVKGEGKDLKLCISVPWGIEFGDLSIKLDIAGIPLLQSAGSSSFLSSAFERISTSRARSLKLRDQKGRLELEVDDLWQAKLRLDAMAKRRDERLQIFADTVNGYKKRQQQLSAESTK